MRYGKLLALTVLAVITFAPAHRVWADEHVTPSLAWKSGAWWSTDRTKSALSGDFNGDSKQDVAMVYDYGNSVTGIWVFEGDGTGGFKPKKYWQSGPWWGMDKVTFAVSGDFNGDGKSEIAMGYPYDNNVMTFWVFEGSGSNFTTKKYWESGPWWGAPNTRIVASGDYSGDGTDDIVVYYDHFDHTSKYNTSTVCTWVFVGSVNSLTPHRSTCNMAGNLSNVSQPLSGKFSPDTADDLAWRGVYRYTSDLVDRMSWSIDSQIYDLTPPNPVNGSFWDSSPWWWGVPNTKLASSGDFNGDGKDDIAMIYDKGWNISGLFVLENTTGTGISNASLKEYWSSYAWWGTDNVRYFTNADYTGDGKSDPVMIYDYGNSITGLWIFKPCVSFPACS